jgi:C-terminal processing protease CtpA/Prc
MLQDFRVYLAIGVLFTTGIIAFNLLNAEDSAIIAGTPAQKAESTPGYPAATSPTPDRVARLEAELKRLAQRVAELEAAQSNSAAAVSLDLQQDSPAEMETIARTQFDNSNRIVAAGVDGLIAAGLDPYRAEEIMRLENELQLQRLELRDQAQRDGTMGTTEFRQAMRDLSAENGLRNQVDEDVYDRYLYHTGQPNRVQVQNVIRGSAADQVGIENGDILLSYNDTRLYSFRELNRLTSGGERGEPVTMVVQRNGTAMTLTLPRGPVGVQLTSLRLDPEEG